MADLVLQLSRVAYERSGRRLLDGVGLSLRGGACAKRKAKRHGAHELFH